MSCVGRYDDAGLDANRESRLLAEAQAIAHVGSWEWDVATRCSELDGAIVPVGTGSAGCVFTSSATNVIVDLNGWWVPAG